MTLKKKPYVFLAYKEDSKEFLEETVVFKPCFPLQAP